MLAYKLFTLRKDGTIGPLFINRRQRIPLDTWIEAGTEHPHKGFTYRPGWHVLFRKYAPHLSVKGRVWGQVEVYGTTLHERPEAQGGLWGLARRMRVLRLYPQQKRYKIASV